MPRSPDDRMPGFLLAGLLVLTAARLLIAGSNELSEDETYYHMWSQRLDWSYYSKGPGIATALWASTSIFGDTSFGVRALSPLLALGSSVLVWRLARSAFDARVAAWTVLLLNLTPIFNAGALVMTIDPLSIFFWLAAMLCLWRALHRSAKVGAHWPLAGLMLGLGFLCKYTNALQILSLFLLLICSRHWRPLLRKPGPYVMLGVFALCTLPVFIWNAGNDWITFTHLVERGSLDSGGFKVKPSEWFTYLGGHFIVYSPLLFAGLLWATWKGARSLGKGDGVAFLAAFAVPIVAMYFILALKKSGELNWTAPGFISVAALLPYFWRRATAGSQRRHHRWQTAALALAAALSLLLMNTDTLRAAGIAWSYGVDDTAGAPEKSVGDHLKAPHRLLEDTPDFSARLIGWRTTAEHVGRYVEAFAEDRGGAVFLIANRYQSAAALNFYLPDNLPLIRPDPSYPRVHTPESAAPQHQFSFWPSYAQVDSVDFTPTTDGDTIRNEISPFMGQSALYVTDDTKRQSPPEEVQRGFERWELVDITNILRRGHFVRGLKIFACYNYRGSDL